MQTVPVAPVFLFDSKDHWIDRWKTAKATLTIARFLGAKRFEFVGYDGHTVALVTLERGVIRPLQATDIPHARTLAAA